MGRITPTFRQLYEETVSELKMELQAALVDLGHKNAFDLLLKEAWNPEQAAIGNSTLPTVCDKLNIMAAIHNRKLIAVLVRELHQRDSVIDKFEERIVSLENQLSEIKRCDGGSPISMRFFKHLFKHKQLFSEILGMKTLNGLCRKPLKLKNLFVFFWLDLLGWVKPDFSASSTTNDADRSVINFTIFIMSDNGI